MKRTKRNKRKRANVSTIKRIECYLSWAKTNIKNFQEISARDKV